MVLGLADLRYEEMIKKEIILPALKKRTKIHDMLYNLISDVEEVDRRDLILQSEREL